MDLDDTATRPSPPPMTLTRPRQCRVRTNPATSPWYRNPVKKTGERERTQCERARVMERGGHGQFVDRAVGELIDDRPCTRGNQTYVIVGGLRRFLEQCANLSGNARKRLRYSPENLTWAGSCFIQAARVP